MSDQATMTKILGDMMTVTDERCLETIQSAAFNRRKELRRTESQVETASWMIGDDVQMLPEYRSRKPYGTVGKILKINQVKMRVDFGNGLIYNVPKTMLIKV